MQPFRGKAFTVSEQAIDLSMVFLLGGDLLQVEKEATDLLASIAAWDDSQPDAAVEWILVVDGPQWAKAVTPATWARPDSNRKCHVLPETTHHPGVMANQGLLHARGEFLAFLWPGCQLEGRLSLLRQMIRVAQAEKIDLVGAERPEGESRSSPFDSWLPAPEDKIPGYAADWMEMLSLVPLSNCVIRRSCLNEVGGFSPSALFQRYAGWEVAYRIAQMCPVRELKLPSVACRWGWHNFPWQVACPIAPSVAARLMRLGLPPARPLEESLEVCLDGLSEAAGDLDAASGQRLKTYVARLCPVDEGETTVETDVETRKTTRDERLPESVLEMNLPDKPLRITLLGGLNEPAHNYPYFYGFFQTLRGLGIVNWRSVYEPGASISDLESSDLVIFSRSRSDNARRLVDFCKAREIPSVFLLDDNWFWLATDNPKEYGSLFVPGKPPYDNFIYCCQGVDAVFTHNRLIKNDISPYARRVVELTPPIDLSLFPAGDRSNADRPRIGYCGGLAWEQEPFHALAAVARRHASAEVFIMTPRLPEPLKELPESQIVFQPYVYNYRQFARVCSEAHPDVLIAPLQDNRSQASKNPRKYLDITAVGAAGVYSQLPPYTWYIEDRRTGLFTTNQTEQWETAIEALLDNGDLRREIVEIAGKDVRDRFSIPALLPEFLQALLSVARPGVRD